MSFPEDSTDSELRETVHDIVRAAVVYGYLHGFERASGAASQALAEAAPPHSGSDQVRVRLAREAAERFLMKVYVEQAIQP